MNFVNLKVTNDFQLSISSANSNEVLVKLNRISAQQLADALREYSGATSKSSNRGYSTNIPVLDITPAASGTPKKGVSVVRLSSSIKFRKR